MFSSQFRKCVLRIHKRFQRTNAAKIETKQPQQTLKFLKGPVFRNAEHFPEKIAIRDGVAGYTYSNIFMSANELAKEINMLVDGKKNERILFLCPNDVNYVITLWAIWISGQIAVPLSPQHPKNMLLYYANDTNSKLLITTSEHKDVMQRVANNTNSHCHLLDDKLKHNCTQMIAERKSDLEGGMPSSFYDKSDALIIYTSGTTGNPKGAVLTHKNLNFQITALLDAWRWSSNDVMLHTLPLHHIHGVVNALLCPLFAGAKTLMLPKFDANTVWSLLLGVNAKPDARKITMYMAVPTIYAKLIEEYEKVFQGDSKMVEYIKNTLKSKIRLMVSGSAPLPVPLYEKWLQISGHKLLERYGMTEIGMALSNEFDSDREPGYVGVPLPGVSVAIADPETKKILTECSNTEGKVKVKINAFTDGNPQGDLLVKSDGVFKEYFGRPEATEKEFTNDGWFKTGDSCEYSVEKKKFKILGRNSIDIIKSGGYKISALEIETLLLGHPDIKECVVVGVNDKKWGQRVAAVVVSEKNKTLDEAQLAEWSKTKMPKYTVPTVWKFVEEVPKNAMGKVNKRELVTSMF